MLLKKIAVSACLLGEFCRYDGKTKVDQTLLEYLKDFKIVPFCPEAPIFGTPRERISLFYTRGSLRVITDHSNKDVTDSLAKEIEKFILCNPDLEMILLKSKSPSCGIGTTPILNEEKEQIALGSGIAASMLQKAFTNIPFYDENSINTLTVETQID
jgi:uncharacterized protein YbbK (DUF523 family)